MSSPTVTGSTASATGAQSATATKRLEEDLHQFMNLLVTQLKNQDPLDPMDSTEFTNQLVQFAGVEQQIHTNANLEKLLKLESSSQVAGMVDYIGKVVEVSGGKLVEFDGKKPVEYSYTLDKKSFKTTIIIRDKDDKVVFTKDGEHDSGRHDATWDGRDKDGNIVKPGVYTVEVSATEMVDGKRKPMKVYQTTKLEVTGVTVEQGKIMLIMGGTYASIDDILAVSAPKTSADASADTESEASEASTDEETEPKTDKTADASTDTESEASEESTDEKTEPKTA